VGALPKQPEERLALARTALKSGSWPHALSIYTTLINSSELLDAVIEDLEKGIRNHPEDFAGYQMVGDAYMKDGRLPSALQAYRTALAKLH
jgi:tetratricopeptide (TPR) repeat protein